MRNKPIAMTVVTWRQTYNQKMKYSTYTYKSKFNSIKTKVITTRTISSTNGADVHDSRKQIN